MTTSARRCGGALVVGVLVAGAALAGGCAAEADLDAIEDGEPTTTTADAGPGPDHGECPEPGEGADVRVEDRTVVDCVAGIRWTAPAGWDLETEDLIGGINALAGLEEAGGREGALVASSTVERVAGAELEAAARSAAHGWAEFFVPFPGERRELLSEPIEVEGTAGHHYRVLIDVADGPGIEDVVVEVVVLATGPATAVLMALSQPPAEGSLAEAIEAAVASVGPA